MTKEQAIKLLRKDLSADEIYSLTKFGLRSAEIQELIQEAMDEGADALEKQVPKKLHIYANGSEHCPNCDANLTGMGFKFCVECGQALN